MEFLLGILCLIFGFFTFFMIYASVRIYECLRALDRALDKINNSIRIK